MHADSELVLLDLISDEFSAHLTTTQRLNAVAAIAALSTSGAEAKLAEIASTQQLGADVRGAALEALVAGRPDRLARWLDAGADGDTGRWRRLAEIRRKGVRLDLSQVSRLKRLLLSVKARQFHAAEIQPDLLASTLWGALGLVVVLIALLPFGLSRLELGEIARLGAPALLVAAAHVWLLGKIAMPVTSSPDRWTFMLPETVGMFISGVLLASLTAAALVAAAELAGARVEDVLACALLHGGLIAIVRLVALLLYGLVRDAGRRQSGSLVVGGFAAVVALLAGALKAAPWDDFAAVPELFGLNLLLAPALPALGYAFARLDGSMEARAGRDRPLHRLALLAPCLLALLLGTLPYALLLVGVRSAQSTGAEVDTSASLDLTGRTADSEPLELLLPYDSRRLLVSPWSQTVTVQARAMEDIRLVVDGEPFDGDSPDRLSETQDLAVQPGRNYEISVSPLSDSAAGLVFSYRGRELFANAGQALFDAVRGVLEPMLPGSPAHETRMADDHAVPAGFARVELRASVDHGSVAAVTAFETRKKALAAAPPAVPYPLAGFGVALDDLKGSPARTDGAEQASAGEPVSAWRLAKGSIVDVDAGSGALRLTAGRGADLPARLPAGNSKLPSDIAWLGTDVPDPEFLRAAMTVAELEGSEDFGAFTTQDWVPLLVAGRPQLADLVRLGEAPRALHDLAVNYPELRATGRGGLFRVLSMNRDGTADAQLLDGWLRPDETLQGCYRIRLSRLLRHPAYDAKAYRAALDSIEFEGAAEPQQISVDADKEPAIKGRQCADWRRPPTVGELVAAKGSYIERFDIDLSAADPPDVFGDYFVVVDDSGSVPPGAIVTGTAWYPDGSPGYDVVQGWSDCSVGCWIAAGGLTHLGPELDTDFLGLPAEFRRSFWLSEQRARYAASSFFGTEVAPSSAADGSAALSGPWAEVAADKGAWLAAYDVNPSAAAPPAVFGDYFVVVGEQGEGAVPPGTLVRGSTWDTDGKPSFAVVYGWSRGGLSTQNIQSVELAHLGADFKPGWLELPLLGSRYAEYYEFGSWRTDFVQTICAEIPLDGCSQDGAATR